MFIAKTRLCVVVQICVASIKFPLLSRRNIGAWCRMHFCTEKTGKQLSSKRWSAQEASSATLTCLQQNRANKHQEVEGQPDRHKQHNRTFYERWYDWLRQSNWPQGDHVNFKSVWNSCRHEFDANSMRIRCEFDANSTRIRHEFDTESTSLCGRHKQQEQAAMIWLTDNAQVSVCFY